MTTQTLAQDFTAGLARISYAEWSERGGRIIAWFRGERWYHRHETETDANASWVAMPAWKARATFPSDGVRHD